MDDGFGRSADLLLCGRIKWKLTSFDSLGYFGGNLFSIPDLTVDLEFSSTFFKDTKRVSNWDPICLFGTTTYTLVQITHSRWRDKECELLLLLYYQKSGNTCLLLFSLRPNWWGIICSKKTVSSLSRHKRLSDKIMGSFSVVYWFRYFRNWGFFSSSCQDLIPPHRCCGHVPQTARICFLFAQLWCQSVG